MYFGKEEEAAIKKYVNPNTPKFEKDRAFQRVVYPALNKLAENVIHNRKFYNYGDDEYLNIKHDCVVHLHDRLSKFNPDKGHRAFSYFNRVAINWVFANMKRVSEEVNDKSDIDVIDTRRNVVNEITTLDYQEELRDFCESWSVWGNNNLEKLHYFRDGKFRPFTQKDMRIANAIFDLFVNCKYIDIYNKKALYILIREQVNVKTQHITDVVNALKPIQRDMYRDFLKTGISTWHLYPTQPTENDG